MSFSKANAPDEELPRWEGDDEFSYKGDMYDVIEKKETNDKLLVKCISDKKEDALVSKYAGLLKDDWGATRKKTSLLLKVIDNLFVYNNESQRPLLPVTIELAVVNYSSPLSSPSSEVLTPPPQLFG